MKWFKYILISLIILILFLGIKNMASQKVAKLDPTNQLAQVAKIAQAPTPIENPKITTLAFVGDMMLTRGVESSVQKNFANDYNNLFTNLAPLKEADILFANLEGDVSDVGNNVGSKYSFRMKPEVLPAIKQAGFNVLSFANNHVGDWNVAAFTDTLNRLAQTGLYPIGAGINKTAATSPTVIEKNGIRFGFLGFSDVGPNWLAATENPGILLASDPNLNTIIANAKTTCDVLIVSFHWGIEYQPIHNTRQEYLAHLAIDNGADLIIGHHPHVIEDIETYKDKPIVYSLGNFIFDQYFSKETMEGMLFTATYENKNLIRTDSKIITLNHKFQPEGIFNQADLTKKVVAINNPCPKPNKPSDDLSLLNVGQTISLPDQNYIPNDLEPLASKLESNGNVCLTKEVADSLNLMLAAAKDEGYTIKVSSGFRNFATQKMLYNESLNGHKADTDISLAKPGYSEHQLGTTVDLTGLSINFASAAARFANSPESDWLKANAYLYGFVLSYPKGQEDVTGYKSEPWHYRYVGLDQALLIKNSGQTITEFLAK